MQRRVEPLLRLAGERRVDREAGRQGVSLCLGYVTQPIEVGPRTLGVDMVGGDGGDTAPVADARIEEIAEVVGEVRWRLDVNVERQDHPGERDCVEIVVAGAGFGVVHRRTGLGQEVLDDHFLDVAVALVACCDRLERIDAVGSVLADTDEDSRRVGDLQFAGPLECLESAGRHLVGRASVGVEITPQGLEHHSLARRDRAKECEFVAVHRTGVAVGEQARLVEHELRHCGDIVDRGVVAMAVEPVPGDRVAEFRLFPEGEERFMATHLGALTGNREYVVGLEVGRVETSGRLRERAVAALVAAQHGQRDEHLRRVSHHRAERLVAAGSGERKEIVPAEGMKIRHVCPRFRCVDRVPAERRCRWAPRARCRWCTRAGAQVGCRTRRGRVRWGRDHR